MDIRTKLGSLFKPDSIALVGAAHTTEKLGGVVLNNLRKFKGRVYPVNPRYDELMGIKAYHSISDIPEKVDLVIVIRPSNEVPAIVRECKDKTSFVIIMSSGFAETGEVSIQEEVKKIGLQYGIRILGPNCMGIFNPYKRLDTFFLPTERLKRPLKGNISLVSQSGAILSCLLSSIRETNAGISIAVGYGNAVDIDEADIYEYLTYDKNTDVVLSYIESVVNGRKFIEKAKLLSKRKPLIILKGGKSPSGQTAAFSHTGRLAGRYEVFHSVLKLAGLKEVKDFDELIDSAKALSYYPRLYPSFTGGTSRGNRVCIITNGGGSGVLAADECIRQGLDLPVIPEDCKKRLSKTFPEFYGINNPVDLTAQVKEDDYHVAMNTLKDFYDGFLIIAIPNVYGITENLPNVIKNAKDNIGKPVVAHIAPGGIAQKIISGLEKKRVPVYLSPERAVRGLKVLLDLV